MRTLIEKEHRTQTEMIAAGYPSNLLLAAQRYTFTEMMTGIWRVPELQYIDELVHSRVELNPCKMPKGDGPCKLLTGDQFHQLLADAGGAWPQYQQRKLAEQAPLPVTPALPWWPLHRNAAGASRAARPATSSEEVASQAGGQSLAMPVLPSAAAAEAAPQLGATGAQAAAATGGGPGPRKRVRFGENVKDFIRKEAAEPAAAAAAGGGAAQGQPAAGPDASAGRQQSSPPGSGQEQQQQQLLQTEAEVEAQAVSAAWMQCLALHLALTTPPASISLEDIRQHVPIPQCVVLWGGGRAAVQNMMERELGVFWYGPEDHISIKRADHLRLLRAAAAESTAAIVVAEAAAAAAAAAAQGAGLTSPLASRQAGPQSPVEQQQAWAAWQGNVPVAGPAAAGLAPQDAVPAAADPRPAAARSQAPVGSGGCLYD